MDGLRKKCNPRFTTAVNKRNGTQKDWSKIAERRGNGPILRDNSLKLLANSTMCVFQWNKSRYRCFCCQLPFSDIKQLREHTDSHTIKDIERTIIAQQNRLVKVEISVLNCKLCSEELGSIDGVRDHLIRHDIDIPGDHLLVPFKLESGPLTCQICSESFRHFRLLNIHMNKHYQKQVCHICGAGFSNLVFLNLHKTRNHRVHGCKLCDLEFSSKVEKRNHDVAEHDLKVERKYRFPCPYCEERFFQEKFRVLHLVERHGFERPEHKCSICGKVYVTKSLCTTHLKKVHLKEKNIECGYCNMRFYSKSDANRHKVTHTGEKNYSCKFCHSLFGTKDSLRRHLKKTHTNVQ